jgi:hypothetical protein
MAEAKSSSKTSGQKGTLGARMGGRAAGYNRPARRR